MTPPTYRGMMLRTPMPQGPRATRRDRIRVARIVREAQEYGALVGPILAACIVAWLIGGR